MLHQEILGFFSTRDTTATLQEELQDIRPYHLGDAKHAINRKKTAQYGELMTNTFDPNTHTHGRIMCIRSENWKKGRDHSAETFVQNLYKRLEESTQHDQRSYIEVSEHDHFPSYQDAFPIKTIVVSDFFFDEASTTKFIQACRSGLAHGIIIPLLTPIGFYHHPLYKEFPQYFWKFEG